MRQLGLTAFTILSKSFVPENREPRGRGRLLLIVAEIPLPSRNPSNCRKLRSKRGSSLQLQIMPLWRGVPRGLQAGSDAPRASLKMEDAGTPASSRSSAAVPRLADPAP